MNIEFLLIHLMGKAKITKSKINCFYDFWNYREVNNNLASSNKRFQYQFEIFQVSVSNDECEMLI